MGYSGRSFPPLSDTTEEVFFHFGIQRKRFFPLWDTMEKNSTHRMIFLNFKCLSLPSNKNLGKICYLNSQNNPWKEVKIENYVVNHEKKNCSIVGYNAAEVFVNF